MKREIMRALHTREADRRQNRSAGFASVTLGLLKIATSSKFRQLTAVECQSFRFPALIGSLRFGRLTTAGVTRNCWGVHPVKFAIFSDIHGNLEALEAVLADITAERVQEMICLGDIVGYGPNPAECLEMIRCLNCSVVMGNHDEACVEPDMEQALNEYARAGIVFAGIN
jgi:hypothetical protein